MVAADVAVRAERALRIAGRARGVEDRGVVFGVDATSGSVASGALGAHRLVERDRPARQAPSPACHDHWRSSAARRGAPRAARRARRRAISTELARVRQPVLELCAGPPGVERHDDRADRRGRPERDRPLGIVAHRDATRSPFRRRSGRRGGGRAWQRRDSASRTSADRVRSAPTLTRRRRTRGSRCRRGRGCSRPAPATRPARASTPSTGPRDHDVLQLEHLPGRRQCGVRLGDRRNHRIGRRRIGRQRIGRHGSVVRIGSVGHADRMPAPAPSVGRSSQVQDLQRAARTDGSAASKK